MIIFQFGAKSTALFLTGRFIGVIFVLCCLVVAIPVLILCIMSDLYERVSKKSSPIDNALQKLLDYLDGTNSGFLDWIDKHFISKKQKMWEELTRNGEEE